MGKYSYELLKLIEPEFGSDLVSLIIDLDYLRKKELEGTTPERIFFQLKGLFHMLESIGSAHIEGNHTTIAEFIDTKIISRNKSDQNIREISNVESVLGFIDKHVKKDTRIDGEFIRELHRRVVQGLSSDKEGDLTPGEYRSRNIKIPGSAHVPPDHMEVRKYMKELTAFINAPDPQKYDLLKVAIAHHRFVWIHPFRNGNGRTVRLLTYAQLLKAGFNVDAGGRIINPTAIFCSDRDSYYDQLSIADSGNKKDLINWSEYVLKGLKNEIEKVDKLTDYSYLSEKILLPALDYSLERRLITDLEANVLKIAVNECQFQASDLKDLFPGKFSTHVSRYLTGMKGRKLISPLTKNGRIYSIDFKNSYILRGVIHMLDVNGFLPLKV